MLTKIEFSWALLVATPLLIYSAARAERKYTPGRNLFLNGVLLWLQIISKRSEKKKGESVSSQILYIWSVL